MSYPARFYAALHRGTPGDLDHYLRVCQTAASVLELGCGYGRVVEALAAPGRVVVGVERDPGLLAMARDAMRSRPKAASAGVELHEGDMRRVRLDRRFDRVLIPFGGLWCMLDDEDVHATLTTAAWHLAPGGRVAFDVYRADAFHAEAEPDDVPDDAFTPVGRVEVDGVPYEVLERSTWDKPRQRIDVTYLYVDEAGHAVEGTIAQRYLLEPQLHAALARAGLRATHVGEGFGDHAAARAPNEDEDEDEDEDEADDDALWVVEAEAIEVEGRDGRAGS
jgi:SAM-dependent methyltransferase